MTLPIINRSRSYADEMTDLYNKNETERKKMIVERTRTHLCEKLAKMITNETINNKIRKTK